MKLLRLVLRHGEKLSHEISLDTVKLLGTEKSDY